LWQQREWASHIDLAFWINFFFFGITAALLGIMNGKRDARHSPPASNEILLLGTKGEMVFLGCFPGGLNIKANIIISAKQSSKASPWFPHRAANTALLFVFVLGIGIIAAAGSVLQLSLLSLDGWNFGGPEIAERPHTTVATSLSDLTLTCLVSSCLGGRGLGGTAVYVCSQIECNRFTLILLCLIGEALGCLSDLSQGKGVKLQLRTSEADRSCTYAIKDQVASNERDAHLYARHVASCSVQKRLIHSERLMKVFPDQVIATERDAGLQWLLSNSADRL
jgi:hypothetical protein